MAATERTALLNGQTCENSATVVDVPLDSAEYEEILSDYEISKGLSLEELLPYKDDPWWQNFRRSMMYSFWFTLLLTFFVACGISYLEVGRCQIAGSSSGDIKFAGNAIESTILGTTKIAP